MVDLVHPLWPRAVALAAALAVVAAVEGPPFVSALPAAAGVAAAPVVALVLFVALARCAPSLRHLPARSSSACSLALSAVWEEVVWRWLVLGALTALVGVGGALAASTAGFALGHVHAQGRRGVAVHLVTGTAFGGLYVLSGSLLGAIAAHVAYNVLVAASAAAAPPAATVAELRDVSKRLAGRHALERVSLAAAEGDVVALLGANGAGKTTALALLAGLRRPDRGSARIFGRDPRLPAARRGLGVALQRADLPPTLRVDEVVRLVRAHHPDAPAPDAILERLGVAALARRQAGGLSGGERRRVAVALALVGAPRLVLLDEPTTGLDAAARREVARLLAELARGGGTVVLATHELADVEALATSVVLLRSGRVVAEGPPAAIAPALGLTRIRIRAEIPPGAADGATVERANGMSIVVTREPGAVVAALVEAGVPLDGLDVHRLGLAEAVAALDGDPS